MDALLAKDAAFFHENFAGSLTKRVLSYASEYEDFVDTSVEYSELNAIEQERATAAVVGQ